MTVTELKRQHKGHFFDRKTMQHCGDTIKSYRVIELNGKIYLYRKLGVTYKLFETVITVTKDNFKCWEYDETDTYLRLSDEVTTKKVLNAITKTKRHDTPTFELTYLPKMVLNSDNKELYKGTFGAYKLTYIPEEQVLGIYKTYGKDKSRVFVDGITVENVQNFNFLKYLINLYFG